MGVCPAWTVFGQESGNDNFSMDRSNGSPETICGRQLCTGKNRPTVTPDRVKVVLKTQPTFYF